MAQHTIVVPDGSIGRIYAMTASRDYDVALTPGTYPLVPTKIDGKPSAVEPPYYFWAPVPATRIRESADHWHKAGELDTYHVCMYGYQIGDRETIVYGEDR